MKNKDLFIIAGPCVIESYDLNMRHAEKLQNILTKLEIPWIYKSSFEKANRSSISSFTGPGLDKGLEILQQIKTNLEVSVLTDIHEPWQAKPVSEVVDVIQIPAFLSRQTNLINAAAKTGKKINVKKGQFLSPWEVKNIIQKIEAVPSHGKIWITERGASFGYNNLVVDMRSIPIIQSFGALAVFDATHSVQLPGKGEKGLTTAGESQYTEGLARSAVAMGCDAVFIEVHENPEQAPCDGSNMLPLNRFEKLIKTLMRIKKAVK